MSINAVNITYTTSAPVAGGSTILAFGGSSLLEFSYVGTATVTGDGSTTSATINLIDGTNVLPWVPTGLILQRTGGNAANSIVSYVSSVTNAAATVTFSAAPGNNASVNYLVLVLK